MNGGSQNQHDLVVQELDSYYVNEYENQMKSKNVDTKFLLAWKVRNGNGQMPPMGVLYTRKSTELFSF